MRLAVLGAGTQARAVVDDFVRFSGAAQIGVADLSLERAQRLVRWADDPRVVPAALDVRDEMAAEAFLRPYDAALSAVPYPFNPGLSRAAVRAGTCLTDLGGNSAVVDQQLALDVEAKAAGVAIVPDLGLAPGMACLLAADLVADLEPPCSLHIRVGGLPQSRPQPLGYRLFFSVQGLINEYIEPCRVLRGGRATTVPGLSELEELDFPAPFGRLEAFQTSGGTSTLPGSLAGHVDELTYKTIRYPGHCAQMRLLRDLGLFSEVAVEVDGVALAPRRLTETLLQQRLSEAVEDVVLMRITAQGRRAGESVTRVEEMIEYPVGGLSAMARTTGYPAAIVTQMLVDGTVERRGAFPQELGVPAAAFRAALRQRGISLRPG